MFVFQKTWRALFSCYLRFEIGPFVLLLTNCENHRGIKLIARMRVGLSHLHEPKFKYSFQDTLTSVSSCGFDIESTFQCVLHCLIYNDEKHTFTSTIKNIDCRLVDVTETALIKTLLFGNCFLDGYTKHKFLMEPLNISELLKDLMNLCFLVTATGFEPTKEFLDI